MYTGGVVTLRSFALVLALLIAAPPVLGVVCAMDCDQPPATSSACHDTSGPRGGTTLRAVPHACDHDHAEARPALPTSSSARYSVGTSVAASAPTLVLATLPETHRATAGASWGPPGVIAGIRSSHITVLRI